MGFSRTKRILCLFLTSYTKTKYNYPNFCLLFSALCSLYLMIHPNAFSANLLVA